MDRTVTLRLVGIILVAAILAAAIIYYYNDNNTLDSAQTEQGDYIVYVSRYNKIHRLSYCSGMEYYTEMYYSAAIRKGYELCENCY